MEEMTAKKQQWTYERLKTVVSDLAVDEYDSIWKDLTSHVGFATNLMPIGVNLIQATQYQQLIVYCLLLNKEWKESDVDCKSTLRFYWDQTYQKCYIISIPQNRTEVREVLLSFLPRDARSAKRGIAIVGRPSVCPSVRLSVSVTLMYRGRAAWITSKEIVQIISLWSSLLGATTSVI